MIPLAITKRLVGCAGFWLLLLPLSASAEFWITEFMAENNSVLLDDYQVASDWVEIFNAGSEAAGLRGYYLTDDPKRLKKWAFPDVRLDGGGFCIVFASGRQPPTEGIFRRIRLGHTGLHANFKLDADGEYLALVRPDGTVAHQYGKPYPAQRSNRSFGLAHAGEKGLPPKAAGYLRKPSPGQANGAIWQGEVKPLYVDQPAGFFDAPFEVSMETSTEGAFIYYTLDGSDPAGRAARRYEKPLRVEGTTILRAQALRPRWEPSRVVTRTYLFPDDIVNQSAQDLSPEWPRGSVNSQRMDYGMDPRIVGGRHPEEEVVASIRALPAISLVMPLENWFDRRRGIYANPQRKGKQWERPVSCELLLPDGARGFQVDAGIRIRGGFSRQGRNPKHALRLIFRKEYGAGKLRYPLFGDEGAKSFDHLDLRTSLNHSWAFGGSYANTLLRDLFCRESQGAMGQPYTRSTFHHLFLNGHYWGIYMTQERSVAAYAASYLGGEPEDYDVVKTKGELIDGAWEAQRELFALARKGGFRDDATYMQALGLHRDGTPNPDYPKLIDLDNVIDYMILTYYSRNMDGPGNPRTDFPNNYYQVYNRKHPDGWKFFAHDMEHTLDRGGLLEFPGYFPWRERYQYLNAHWLHDQLALNPHYVNRFEERVDKHLFADGALAPQVALARFERRVQEIDQAIIAHSARWGDASRSQPLTRDDWLRAVDDVRRFIRRRPADLLEELGEWGLYRGVTPPVFVSVPGATYVKSSEGTIYYTTNGSDPRGGEGPSATARQADPAVVEEREMVGEDAVARVWVPGDGRHDATWFQPEFDDRAWPEGRSGIGYDDDGDYLPMIRHDVGRRMRGRRLGLYARFAFQIDGLSALRPDALELAVKVEDGFVAYLNGQRFATFNAPERLDFRAAAVHKSNDEDALRFRFFTASPEVAADLREGENVLAIHLLNVSADSSDLLLIPRLTAKRIRQGTPLPADVPLRIRAFHDGKWSPVVRIP